MEHPILIAIRRASFTPLGWFAPKPEDRAPEGARFIILIGNAGPHMFQRFAREFVAEEGLHVAELQRWLALHRAGKPLPVKPT